MADRQQPWACEGGRTKERQRRWGRRRSGGEKGWLRMKRAEGGNVKVERNDGRKARVSNFFRREFPPFL